MAKTPTFSPSLFTATEFDTPYDKAKFANHFARFVLSGFKETLFFDWFYKRLSMTFGHIAHYNRGGFYATWFADTPSRLNFLKHAAAGHGYGSPAFTYSDVEKVLTAWVRESKLVDLYAGLQDGEVEQRERAELARLTFKYAPKA